MKHRKFSRIIIATLLLTMTAWLLPTGLLVDEAKAETWDAFKVTAVRNTEFTLGKEVSYSITIKNTTNESITTSWINSWYYKDDDIGGITFGKIYSGNILVADGLDKLGEGIEFKSGESKKFLLKGEAPLDWDSDSCFIIVVGDEKTDQFGQINIYEKSGQTVVTENQLFGKYSGYLDNKAYSKICTNLISDIDAVVGEKHDSWLYFRTVLKWIGGMEAARVIKSYLGKDTTADEIAEKQALDLVYSTAGDSTLMQDVMNQVKNEYKWTSKTYSVVSKGYQYASDQKAVKELIASGYCYTKDTAWDLVNGMEDNWKEINKYFKAAGVTVNLAEITVQVAMTMEADHEVISILKENAGKGT